MTHLVIRSTPFRGCGQYFCGLLDGEDEVWSSSQKRALRFRPKDRDMAALTAVGLQEEARVVRVVPMKGAPR